MDFASLKRSRSQQLEALQKSLQAQNPQGSNDDTKDIYWKPTVDDAGNGQAIIRFLPAPPGEDVPFIRYWKHAFQGPGGWYIENSLTTIGQADPVSEHNKILWDTGTESNKDLVRKQKRKLFYVANIYVVKDPGNPENEGKVFLFQFGKKIFDKINDLMTPDPLEPEKALVNPFDLWEGANFRLRIRQVEGYRNYDKSEFDRPSELLKSDDAKEEVWKKEHSLAAIIAPDKFKSYDELKARLNKVLGIGGAGRPAAPADSGAPWDEQAPAPAPSRERAPRNSAAESHDESEDDFFSRLADD